MSLNRISHDDDNHIGSAKRDVVGGVAGLDASAKIAQAQMPDLLIQSQTPQVLTGAGAVDITSAITFLVTGGVGDAITLADGIEGQHKSIITKTESTGGDTSILTPAHLRGYSNITFDSQGECANLIYLDSAWNLLAGRGVSLA